MTYTGIRSKIRNRLQFNAWIEMDTRDEEAAVAVTREKLRAVMLEQPAIVLNDGTTLNAAQVNEMTDALKPWEVKAIPQSWGYPERVMVTW